MNAPYEAQLLGRCFMALLACGLHAPLTSRCPHVHRCAARYGLTPMFSFLSLSLLPLPSF